MKISSLTLALTVTSYYPVVVTGDAERLLPTFIKASSWDDDDVEKDDSANLPLEEAKSLRGSQSALYRSQEKDTSLFDSVTSENTKSPSPAPTRSSTWAPSPSPTVFPTWAPSLVPTVSHSEEPSVSLYHTDTAPPTQDASADYNNDDNYNNDDDDDDDWSPPTQDATADYNDDDNYNNDDDGDDDWTSHTPPPTPTELDEMTQGPVRNFVPLTCNENLQFIECIDWSVYFGAGEWHYDPLVIPCGICVQVDEAVAGPVLTWEQGMDIQGKLKFPHDRTQPLTIRSPHIVVQGEWEVQATQHRVTGQPLYEFVLIGPHSDETQVYLDPIQENRNACVGAQCNVGSRVIAVAGGRLNVNGIPDETLTWAKLHDVITTNETSILILPKKGIRNKWEEGAEVLITSHTPSFLDDQVARIAKVLNYYDETALIDPDEYVQVHLEAPLQYLPTTEVESVEYAVEVALLSRNIVFRGEALPDQTHIGAQMVVFHTPTVAQNLQGVDIQNFGQQGYLGRYPIHFHFCENVAGALVARNTIRQSNQRCVVIHGTHNLTISENVAYDTAGHCYLLEDGHEVHNQFLYNLGARTYAPKKIIPNSGTNGRETDRMASTYWITHPTNDFIGNVAAGSSDSGFWFEPKLRGDRAVNYPHLDPRGEPLGIFRGNVAHSNIIGFRFYPSGYRPSVTKTTNNNLENLRAHRNVKGLFLHLSANMKIVGGLYADNRDGVEIDRSDNIDMENVTIVGVSESFHRLLERQPSGVREVCRHGSVVGLELHTWKNNPELKGSNIRNITFEGFTNTNCPQAHAIRVDNRIQTPLFDLYTRFENIHFEEDAERMFFCDAIERDIDAYFTDMDGSLDHLVNSERHRPATIMSDTPTMRQFVDMDLCRQHDNTCSLYCRNQCFRTVQYQVNPAATEDWMLQVCTTVDPTSCVKFSGYYRGRDPTNSGRHRTFHAYLPTGSYTAVFLDPNGNQAWPDYVETTYQEDELCPTALEKEDVELVVPVVDIEESCIQLIQNGHFEVTDNNVPEHWLHRFGGLKADDDSGIGASTAATSNRASATNTIVQYIDNRCLIEGRIYEIEAWVKLLDAQGKVYYCDWEQDECPQAGLDLPAGRRHSYAFATGAINSDGYMQLKGTVEIDHEFVSMYDESSPTALFLRPNRKLHWYVDSVSMKLL